MQKQEILKTIAERVTEKVAGMDEEIKCDSSSVYSFVNDETFFIELEEVRGAYQSYYCSAFQANAEIFDAQWLAEFWFDLEEMGVYRELETLEKLIAEDYPEDLPAFWAHNFPERYDDYERGRCLVANPSYDGDY